MKKIIVITSSIIAFLIIVLVIVLAWHGMFSKPQVIEKEMGPFLYVYEEFTGDYSKTMPAFDTVYSRLKQANIVATVGIGIYLDNPEKVPADQLRSYCGSVYNEQDSLKIGQTGLKKGIVTQSKYAVIEFPIKSVLSYMIGPIKCYPVFSEYFKNKGIQPEEGIELYDMEAKKAYYLMALSN